MRSSKSIADWFLRHAADEGTSLTNMQVQKLVYLAESCFGSLYDNRLVNEDIQAWQHGPAVKPLYGQLKANGNNAVPAPERAPDFSEDVEEVLDTIWKDFGHLNGATLRKLTHDHGPYGAHYRNGVRDIVLPPPEIHDAWPEFLNAAITKNSPRANKGRAKLRNLASRAARREKDRDQENERDIDQLMSDFRAFAGR